MEEKIPHEVLLPIVLELYQKIPHPDEFHFKPNSENGETRKLEQEADDFAIFYRRLHEKLVAQ